MTREGAKKWAKEIKAFTEGKTIQILERDDCWCDTEIPCFVVDFKYRIKPESKLVPFDFTDAEKLIGKVVKVKNMSTMFLVTAVFNNLCNLSGFEYTYEKLLSGFTFLDGSPCGKEV